MFSNALQKQFALTRCFVVCAGGSLVVSSLSIFFIYMVQTQVQSLLLSCIFSSVSVICWNSLDVLGTELYPTQLRYTYLTVAHRFWWICLDGLHIVFCRSSALGFFTGVGRVAAITANIVFGKLVDTNCAVPVLLVSVLLLTGGLVALLLPQTKQTELAWPPQLLLYFPRFSSQCLPSFHPPLPPAPGWCICKLCSGSLRPSKQRCWNILSGLRCSQFQCVCVCSSFYIYYWCF